MSPRSTLLAGLMLSGVSAHALAGDEQPPAGTRVRITAPSVASERLIGTILTEDEGSLTIAVKGRRETLSLPRSALTRMEVSQRRSRRGTGAARGALAGAAVGAVVGYATGDSCSGDEWLCFSHGQMATAGAVVFAPIGALIGLVASPGERWQEVPAHGLRISATPVPVRGRGFGLTVSVGF